MGNFNPAAPTKLGLQWLPTLVQSAVIDNFGKAVIARVPSVAAENIGTARLWVPVAEAANRRWELEVTLEADEAPDMGSLIESIANPNEDVTVTSVTGSPTNTVGNRYQNIDDAVPPSFPPGSDYIEFTTVSSSTYEGRMNTAGLSLTGRRILAVTLVFGYSWPTGNTLTWAQAGFLSGLNIGGTVYGVNSADEPFASGGAFLSNLGVAAGTAYGESRATWYVNPSTGDPWSIADVQSFDSTNEFTARAYYIVGISTNARLHYAYMIVAHVPENRVARGARSGASAGWNDWTLTTPTGGTWAKANGSTYSYILRRSGLANAGAGSLQLRALDAGELVPMGHGSVLAGALGTYRNVTTATEAIDTGTAALPIIPRTTVPADSNDAQPYSNDVQATTSEAIVRTGQNADQEISGATADDYGLVEAILKHGGAPTADLTLGVFRRSDNVQMGGTLTITQAEIDALPDIGGGWKLYSGTLPVLATLAGATQYYLRFSSSTADTAAARWKVLALFTGGQGNGQTYGGTTDIATLNGGDDSTADLAVTLATVPDPPADPEVTDAGFALDGDGSDCSLTTLFVPRISWVATALGAEFDYYELQRSDDGGTTWDTIVHIETESAFSFDDIAAPRNVQSCYRVRVVRTDGAVSDWSPTVCLTPADPTCGAAAWLFMTPHAPERSVAYNLPPEQEYEFLTAENIVRRQLHGRNYQVAFVPLENRGVRFTIELLVSVDQTNPPGGRGVAAFLPLRALAEATDLPYVVVLDHEGNRWYASIRLLTGRKTEPFGFHRATVEVVEIEDTPTIVTVA